MSFSKTRSSSILEDQSRPSKLQRSTSQEDITTAIETLSIASFKCLECGKCFTRKTGLQNHYRIHTGERPFPCSYESCDRSFRIKSDCLSHESAVHRAEKKHVCHECETAFAKPFALKRHLALRACKPVVIHHGRPEVAAHSTILKRDHTIQLARLNDIDAATILADLRNDAVKTPSTALGTHGWQHSSNTTHRGEVEYGSMKHLPPDDIAGPACYGTEKHFQAVTKIADDAGDTQAEEFATTTLTSLENCSALRSNDSCRGSERFPALPTAADELLTFINGAMALPRQSISAVSVRSLSAVSHLPTPSVSEQLAKWVKSSSSSRYTVASASAISVSESRGQVSEVFDLPTSSDRMKTVDETVDAEEICFRRFTPWFSFTSALSPRCKNHYDQQCCS